jgi:Uma2 family endonuclease
MGVPIVETGPMTVEDFYAFTDKQPDEEKWELIDGEPILNVAPSPLHQRIVKSLTFALTQRERESAVSWEMLPGLGVRVSATSRPEPDVLVLPRAGISQERDRSDVIVAFEILSPSTTDRDLGWKRKAYTGLPSLTHYVVIAQDAVDVVVFAREEAFAERRLRTGGKLDLPSLGISLSLSEIYRDTGLL